MSEDMKCYACGGRVKADGMADGGEVESSGEHEMVDDAVNSDGDTTQMRGQMRDDRMAAKRFVRAVRGGR
jgi:hypothetical protein